MPSSTRRFVVVVIACIAGPGGLHSQTSPRAAEAVRTAQEVQAWFGELEELHEQLEEIQAAALADPVVSAAQIELGTRVRAAMEQLDPALTGLIARMEVMESEANAAQQRGDSTRMAQLVAEADQIQRSFFAAQQRVLAQPEIAAEVTAFQQLLERKMVEIDSNAPRIIARFRELEALLAAEAEAPGTP